MSELGISAGSAAIGAGMGIVGQAIGNSMQTGQARDLQEVQLEGQQRMAKTNKDMALQLWKDTNASAQRREYEKAGLNIGLMYGGGGQGGSTSVASGSTAGQSASSESGAGKGMEMMNASLMNQAQIELAKSQTVKNLAEAENISGGIKENLATDVINKELVGEGIKLDNILKEETQTANIQKAGVEVNKLITEMRRVGLENQISEQVIDEKIKQIELETISKTLENELTKNKIELTEEQKRAISEELAQGWEKLYIGLKDVGTKQHQNAINEFTAKINAKLGKGNLDMRKVEAGLQVAGKILGNKSVTTHANGKQSTTEYR